MLATTPHDEQPGQPGYTPGGDTAGNSGNVAASSSPSATARSHIELWMTGPFHAIGILRPGLKTTGFGMCTGAGNDVWKSADGATWQQMTDDAPWAPRAGAGQRRVHLQGAPLDLAGGDRDDLAPSAAPRVRRHAGPLELGTAADRVWARVDVCGLQPLLPA